MFVHYAYPNPKVENEINELFQETFDFTGVKDGYLDYATIDSSLPLPPFEFVRKEDGELHVGLVHLTPFSEAELIFEKAELKASDYEEFKEKLYTEESYLLEHIKTSESVAKMVWKTTQEIKREELQQEKQVEHQEKKQLAEKLIMDRMVSDYILSDDLSAEEKDMFINLFDLWEPNTAYSRGDKLVYEGLAYEVIQAHTSQSNWLPNELPALYKLFYQTSTDDGTIVIPEWKQPLGAHDAYDTGDLVFHKEKTWESQVDGNIWEPSVYGWIEYVE